MYLNQLKFNGNFEWVLEPNKISRESIPYLWGLLLPLIVCVYYCWPCAFCSFFPLRFQVLAFYFPLALCVCRSWSQNLLVNILSWPRHPRRLLFQLCNLFASRSTYFFLRFFFLSWPFSGRPAGRPHGNLTLQHVRIFPKKKSEEAANKKNIREHGAQNKYFQDKLWAYSLGSVSPAMKCLMGNGKYLNFYKLGGAHKLSVRNSCGFHGFSFFFPAAFFFSFVWRILFVTFRFFVYLEAIVVYLDASQIFSAIGPAPPLPFPIHFSHISYMEHIAYSHS